MLENKTLVIIRHAHRNKSLGRETDNGLSPAGQKQAKAAAKFFKKSFGRCKPLIYSSPKARCIQTLEPIAKKLGIKIQILNCLDESTTSSEMRLRIREFEALWRNTSDWLMLICSHGDWIPAFVKHLCGAEIDLDKGGWIQIELEGDTPRIRSVIQELD